MQDIYDYIGLSEIKHGSGVNNVAVILLLKYIAHVMLFPTTNVVYLYISTFRSTCAVPRYFGQMFSERFRDGSSPPLLVWLWFYITHTLYFYC
jgi:hypothetical protein